jgi:anti-sigma factor RsiW
MRPATHRETALVHALADGELTQFEAARVRAHLAHCAACARELGDAVQMGDLARRLAALQRSRSWCAVRKPPVN